MENNIRIIYDDENIQDVKIEFGNLPDIKESIKTFCIDTLSEDLEIQVEEDQDGSLIVHSNNGEKALTHILKFMYLVTKLAMKAGDQMKDPEFSVEDLDLSILKEDIEMVQDADYKTLNLLLSTLGEDGSY